MRAWAARCERLVVAPGNLDRAVELLGVEPGALRRAAQRLRPAGVPAARRRPPRRLAAGARRRAARLASRRGGRQRRATARPRSPRSSRGPVILYVGRFTEVKRLPLLLEAFADARTRDGLAGLADRRRRPSRRVGGRAPRRGDRPPRPERRHARRLARPVRAAGAAGRLRPARAAVRARELRPGDRRGDGLRRAGRRGGVARPGSDHRRRGDGLAVRRGRSRRR